MRRLVLVLATLALVAAACTSSSDSSTTTATPATSSTSSTTTEPASTTTEPSTTTSTGPVTTTTSPGAIPAGDIGFAGELSDVPLITDGVYAGPSWPSSLADVAFADAIPTDLHDDLITHGFAIERVDIDYVIDVEGLTWATQWSTVYDMLSPYAGRPVFVTTDVAYHLWHQVFDQVLRETEAERLLPVLEQLVTGLVDAARSQDADLAGTVTADAASRATEFVEAIATVLEVDVGAIGDRAAAEVALVEEATAYTESPTVGGSCDIPTASCVDYSLTRPRGHYTRTEDLTRYFRAMSMLGNVGFSVGDVETLRVGLVVAGLITSDDVLSTAWETIYAPTAFLVGAADDYTPFEAADVAADVVAGGLEDPAALTDEAVTAIGEGLLTRRDVRIDPSLAALRTMGTRFVLDSWVYDQLTDPGVPDRLEPSPLDLASVMGSGFAASAQAGESATYVGYDARVAQLRDVAAARTIDEWGRTVYDAWLYSLEPLWADRHDAAFPPFMTTEAWDAKAHNAGFSSYAELKHDTILYAKQGIAEGEAPEPPPAPRHWVEPDPVAFGRLAAVARLMRDGLVDAGSMLGGDYDVSAGDPWDPEQRTRWSTEWLIDTLGRLERIARDELDALPISAEDNDWLSWFGARIGGFVEAVSLGELEPTPIVADIFLNPFPDQVLEVATGPLDLIHVLVPDDQGAFQVATGAAYSYHEFWGPRAERLTDEEWWDRIVDGELPERPTWWTDELG